MFNTKTDAIGFLKSLDGIIMPVDFTYLNHCTSYILPQNQDKNNPKIWQELPTDVFTLYKEMSFTERDARIISALKIGGVNRAPIQYAIPSLPHLPFIIRVIMPKLHNNLNLPETKQKKLELIYSGYGDNRHPKLANGTNVYMFASSTVDEVSGKHIDILYGVREEDVILYANHVYAALQKQEIYPYPQMPIAKEINITQNLGFTNIKTTQYQFTTDFEFNHHTYTIPKSKNFSRYQQYQIKDKEGNIQATMESKFESELRTQQHKSR